MKTNKYLIKNNWIPKDMGYINPSYRNKNYFDNTFVQEDVALQVQKYWSNEMKGKRK